MSFVNPITACDFYKVGHRAMYPEGTTKIYSNFTPRSNKHAPAVNKNNPPDSVLFFGLQGFIQSFLIDSFNENFFNRPKKEVIAEYARRMDTSIGPGVVPTDHIAALHDLGYLPIQIKALPEGALVHVKVPVLTITNTLPEFFWLVNYLETALSTELWKSTTTATTAFQYRKLFSDYAKLTGSPLDFVLWQGHDFSLRGVSGLNDSASSAGHLLSFLGTDTIPAIDYLEKYYSGLNTFVGGSVAATEHSVMAAGGKETEVETFRRLITKVVPTGIVSIVSDTWDFWNVITNTARELKQEILDRKENALGIAKVVFRPDSGDPADIICGLKTIPENVDLTPADKGAVECLWDIFGGTVNEKGYKVLHPRVGLIYGDSITLEVANDILQRLEAKGFASCNVVFGIGSYTYQYVTRDSYGFAMKATYAEIDNVGHEIYKDPVTDTGVKKSARGLLRVEREKGVYRLYDSQTIEQEQQGELITVFLNGRLTSPTTLTEIRQRIEARL